MMKAYKTEGKNLGAPYLVGADPHNPPCCHLEPDG